MKNNAQEEKNQSLIFLFPLKQLFTIHSFHVHNFTFLFYLKKTDQVHKNVHKKFKKNPLLNNTRKKESKMYVNFVFSSEFPVFFKSTLTV